MPALSQASGVFMHPGPVGLLEVEVVSCESPRGVMLIGHPHPLYQGTMNNKVVTTLAKVAADRQLISVRFNFRGVGASEGSYGEVEGECDDMRAIHEAIQLTWPDCPVWLAGFSFGSYVASRVAVDYPPQALIAVAPPVHHNPFEALPLMSCPWLVIQGDEDEVVPFEKVSHFCESRQDEIQFEVLPGATHFFHGHLMVLRECASAFCESVQLS